MQRIDGSDGSLGSSVPGAVWKAVRQQHPGERLVHLLHGLVGRLIWHGAELGEGDAGLASGEGILVLPCEAHLQTAKLIMCAIGVSEQGGSSFTEAWVTSPS